MICSRGHISSTNALKDLFVLVCFQHATTGEEELGGYRLKIIKQFMMTTMYNINQQEPFFSTSASMV